MQNIVYLFEVNNVTGKDYDFTCTLHIYEQSDTNIGYMNGNVYSKYFDLTLKLITISTFTPKYFTQIDMEKKKDTKLDHNIKTKARVLK